MPQKKVAESMRRNVCTHVGRIVEFLVVKSHFFYHVGNRKAGYMSQKNTLPQGCAPSEKTSKRTTPKA